MSGELLSCLSGLRDPGDGDLLVNPFNGSLLSVTGYKRKNLGDLHETLGALHYHFQITYGRDSRADATSLNPSRLLSHFLEEGSIPLILEPIVKEPDAISLPVEYDCEVVGSRIADEKQLDLPNKYPNDHRPIAAVFGAMAFLYPNSPSWSAGTTRDGTTIRIFFFPTDTLRSDRLVELDSLLYDTVQLSAVFLYPRVIEVILLATSNAEYSPFNRARAQKRKKRRIVASTPYGRESKPRPA